MVEKKINYRIRVSLVLFILISMLLACDFFTRDPQRSNQNQASQNNVEDQEEQNTDQNNQAQDQDPEEPGTVQGQSGEWVVINHGGFGFWYDPMVIEDILPESVPLAQEAPYKEAHPPFVQYALLLDSGSISVVEIGWYKNTSETAAQIFPDLEELIESKTPLGLDCIPELPLLDFFRSCDHQQFNANTAFVDFENGSGVRFVTVYAIQDTAPIDNQHLVYVYQGITDDGLCYVNATFRITHDELEESAEVPVEVYSDMTGMALEEYFSGYEQILSTGPEGYMPSLERFDQIIQSIEVSYCLGG
ncbi:MAG: hypothetical protein ABFS17_01085 [Chloroflexota bacterium]